MTQNQRNFMSVKPFPPMTGFHLTESLPNINKFYRSVIPKKINKLLLLVKVVIK